MTAAPQVVIDASALLAALHNEPGGEVVEPRLSHAAMCSVNWTEVVQKTLSWGIDIDGLRRDVEGIGLTIVPFTAVDAETSVGLWSPTRPLGLSLADRACLALARRLDLPVLTSDREWARLDVGVVIETVR